MHRLLILFVAALAVILPKQAALAQTAPISLQGRLSGVPDGERQFVVTIWDAEVGGNAVATAAETATVRGGVFSLDAVLPANAFAGSPRWWSVEVDGSVTDRRPLASVPSALAARTLVDGGGDVVLRYSGEALVMSRDEAFADFDSWVFANANPAPDVLAFGMRNASRAYPSTGEPWWLVLDQRTGFMGLGLATPEAELHVAGRIIADERLVARDDVVANDDVIAGGQVQGATMETGILTITGGSDLAEPFPAAPAAIQPKPGMVLSIDPRTPGALRVSDEAYDTKVAGVYSGGNGLPTGMLMGKDGCELTTNGDDRLPLAMTGRVWVYADASGGEIRPGDRLTTSGVNAGYAARVADASRADGAVIGKAMTGIDEATGMVLVLVNLQ